MKQQIAILFCCIALGASAQTKTQPWAIDFNVNFREYKGDIGSNLFRFKDKNSQIGIGFHRYLHQFVDGSLFVTYGNQRYIGSYKDTTLSRTIDMQLRGFNINGNARIKLDNGLILPENYWVGPYLTLGLGYMSLKNTQLANNNEYSFLSIPIGAGLRFKVHPRINLILQTAYNLTLNDAYDSRKTGGNDKLLEHKVSLNFNFGGKDGKDLNLVSDDQDGDGVKDAIDRCPNTPKGSKVDAYGCLIVSKEANEQLRELIKNIYFETNSAQLKKESLPNLDKVAEILAKFPESRLIIEGHTDADGEADYNLNLSQSRADAVRTYLIAKGVAADRLASKGYGETMPVATNATPEGKALNRRVVLILTK